MHACDADPASTPSDPRRVWKRLAVLSVAALLLHGAALSGFGWAWPSRELPPRPANPVQVRVLEPAAPPPVAAPAAAPVEATATAIAIPAPLRLKPVVARDKPAVTRAAELPASPAATPPAPFELALAAPAPAAAPGDEAIPHYRTRLPPALTLRYEMQRGVLRGTGDLSWRPQGDRYELKLDARVGGLPVLTQVSRGGFDAAGLAPVRFTDQRLRRGTSAANFQREAGKITFSGPATEFALRDGAQDRLSWMIQLAAIVAAEPQLGEAGAKVAMYVVGSHGDASVWVFRCSGPESVATGAGEVQAIKFTREPREAYDTLVQVWLDPAQHAVPVHALQKSGANDEGFELRLRELVVSN